MRAIVNISSARLSKMAGFRARAITVEKSRATLSEVLKQINLMENDGSIYQVVAEGDGFKEDFSIFVKGTLYVGDKVDLNEIIRDNEQLHLGDWPFETRDA